MVSLGFGARMGSSIRTRVWATEGRKFLVLGCTVSFVTSGIRFTTLGREEKGGGIGIPTASDEFPLPDYFPTTSEDRFPPLSKRDAPASEVCTADEVKRNRSDLVTMSLNDLYNHLKVYEPEVQKKSESNSQNMTFISSAKNSSGKEEVNTASCSTASTQVSPASADVATAILTATVLPFFLAEPSLAKPVPDTF
nr:hypothetical protein [Tanacetum cinerariifolium]